MDFLFKNIVEVCINTQQHCLNKGEGGVIFMHIWPISQLTIEIGLKLEHTES